MQIIRLDESTFAAGRAAFRAYAQTQAGTGPRVVIGAIMACIESGTTRGEDIIDAVTRISRCRSTTVEYVLRYFAGSDPKTDLWTEREGRYSLLASEASGAVLLV